MRGPPDTIIEEVAVAGDGGNGPEAMVSGRRLANIDFSEYEWMGEEGVEEFDRKCMEELWAEEFMDMVLVNVLEGDNEEVVDFLLPIYENMMQQMTLADDEAENASDGDAEAVGELVLLDGEADCGNGGFVDVGFHGNEQDGGIICIVTTAAGAEAGNNSLDNSCDEDDDDDNSEGEFR